MMPEAQEIELLRWEVGALRQELAVAQARIAELEARLQKQGGPPAFVKANRAPRAAERPPRKKRAVEHNTSRKRSVPTRIVQHALERCSECQYVLRGSSLGYRREVIELPEPQPVEVIEHQVLKRWCPHCEKWRSPQLALSGVVFGQGRLGVRLASLVSYLRTTLGVPVRGVQRYLATLHNLRVSVGGLVGLSHCVREHLQPHADQLRGEVQQSLVVHGDETGWREDGQNGYIWAFATAGTAPVRYFEYAHSRSHRVAQRILGSHFGGWLVTDFYAAYNLIPGRHQRCWVHLLGDLHDLKAKHADQAEVVQWATAVRQVYDAARTWLRSHPTPTPAERRTEYEALVAKTCALGQQHAQTQAHPCNALAKRLLRHQDELFQFLLLPELPAHNNLAERSIRPLVVLRKISGGSRSPNGTRTRLTLASLFHTWAARNLNPFGECLAALRQPSPAPT